MARRTTVWRATKRAMLAPAGSFEPVRVPWARDSYRPEDDLQIATTAPLLAPDHELVVHVSPAASLPFLRVVVYWDIMPPNSQVQVSALSEDISTRMRFGPVRLRRPAGQAQGRVAVANSSATTAYEVVLDVALQAVDEPGPGEA